MYNDKSGDFCSSSFTKKVKLPQRSTLRWQNKLECMVGEFQVRRRHGILWHPRKARTCVLLNSGCLLVYSSPFDGLNIYLPSVGSLKHRFSRNDSDNNQAQCDVTISKGRAKLEISIKGEQSTVLKWRRGIICSHQGLSIPGSHLVDELFAKNIHQSNVDSEVSKPLSCLSNQVSLSINKFQNMDQKADIVQHNYCDMMYLRSDNCDDSSFGRNSNGECTLITDSGVWSFVSENPEVGKSETMEVKILAQPTDCNTCDQESDYMHWRVLTVAAKLPMLSAEILNFESAFRREDPSFQSGIA